MLKYVTLFNIFDIARITIATITLQTVYYRRYYEHLHIET